MHAPQQQPPTRPSERVWEVDCFVSDPERGLILPDPVGVREAMFEAQAILTRCGGIMQIGSKREQGMDGQVVTTKLLFRWQTFAPLAQPEGEPAMSANGNGSGPVAEEAAAEEEPAKG